MCHRAQDGFLGGKLNSRMKGKCQAWQSVSGGVRVQEAGAVHHQEQVCQAQETLLPQ